MWVFLLLVHNYLIREMLLSHSAQLDVEPTTPPYEDKRFLKTYWPYTIDNPCNDLELLEAALRLGIANHEHIHPLVADVPSIVHLTLPKLRNSVGLVYPGKVPKGLDEIPQVMRNDPFVQREFYVETVTRSRRNLDRDVILAGIKSENPMFCADFFFNMNLEDGNSPFYSDQEDAEQYALAALRETDAGVDLYYLFPKAVRASLEVQDAFLNLCGEPLEIGNLVGFALMNCPELARRRCPPCHVGVWSMYERSRKSAAPEVTWQTSEQYSPPERFLRLRLPESFKTPEKATFLSTAEARLSSSA